MDSSQKAKYEKYRYAVKKWEREFKRINNMVPTKADIKSAPNKIKEAYKNYWTLKTLSMKSLSEASTDENAKDCFNSSSENTDPHLQAKICSDKNVNACDESMCFQPLSETLNGSQLDIILPQDGSSCLSLAKQLTPKKSNDSGMEASQNTSLQFDMIKNLTPTSFKNLFNKEKNLNTKDYLTAEELFSFQKEPSEQENKLKMEAKSVSFQYAEKLFACSKFNKQNPRKPRKFSRTKTLGSISDGKSEDPTNKSEAFKRSVSVSDVGNSTQESLFTGFSQSSFVMDEGIEDAPLPIFNGKLKITTHTSGGVSGQAVSLLQKTFDNCENKQFISHSVDQGWLDRLGDLNDSRSKKFEHPGLAESQDSGVSSIKTESFSDSSIFTSTGSNVISKDDDSSTDLIYDSDCDSKSQSFCKLNLLDTLNRSTSTDFKSKINIESPVSSFKTLHNNVSLEYTEKVVSPQNSVPPNSIESEPNEFVSGTNERKRLLFEGEKTQQPAPKKLRECLAEDDIYSFVSTTKPELVVSFDKFKKKTERASSNSSTNDKLEILEKKLASGGANENFVKINIEKKKFVRGHKKMNFAKYKKQKWKEIKKNNSYAEGRGILKCFRCGDVGHFSRACPNKTNALLPLEDYDSTEESPFPSLEEAAELANEAAARAHKGGRKFTTDEDVQQPVPEPADNSLLIGNIIKPLYSLNEHGSVIETPSLVYSALRELDHKEFRPGQEEGVMRILSGLSTIVTLSTGSGKSLIYQLPAYLYNKLNPGCITLVISPLVSLMEDQVFCGSKKLKAACLHHNMTQKKREVVLEALKAQELAVLLIAPESLSSWDSARSLFKILPPIAFACIDEAHSISQFSHNFRPCYLTICQVLKEKLGISTILGLTATASKATLSTVISQIGVIDDSVITDTPLPDNLLLSVSSEENRQEALLTLLQSERYCDCNSIIVYCTRREECDKVAGLLRTALQNLDGANKKGRLSLHAEAYHAGLTAGRRNQVQSAFMTGKLRIVVATVAFGMGINKNDIRGIIHYNMPYSFESYVQEIGRAGRDREPAHCHLFLDSKRNDLNELCRHIYADTMDRHILRKLLQLVFVPCNCQTKQLQRDTTVSGTNMLEDKDHKEISLSGVDICSEGTCSKHEVAFPIEHTIISLDLPQEVISTLLAYLQLDKERWIKVLPMAYTKCKITSYKGPRHLKKVARTCPPLAMILAEHTTEKAFVEFDIVELSRKINWDSGVVKHTLKQLEWTTVKDKPQKSGIIVDFSCLGFRVLSPGNLNDTRLDQALDLLHSKVKDQEEARLKQLLLFFNLLKNVAHKTVSECCDSVNIENCKELKAVIREFFTSSDPLHGVEVNEEPLTEEAEVAGDIRRLIALHSNDVTFTGRSIARILHGIGSPNFPPIVWGRTKFWRLHLEKKFNSLVKLANKQLILMR